ncbi:ribonuclease HII [Candidatus Babeliales bacterium]|nr:ribonuclease HII [Candidatus Babeliales bacterium]
MKNINHNQFPLKDSFEMDAWKAGNMVCGVDEVGRGCLAGSVLTAAVVLHPHASHPNLKDSKLLDAATRQETAVWIRQHSWYGFGWGSALTIDRLNIYQTTLIAMKRAILQAVTQCGIDRITGILVDAMPLTFSHTFPHVAIHSAPRGEHWSRSIAAASILAKVYRDDHMKRLARSIPGYTLGGHKGYATPHHCQAVVDHGASCIHRMSFLQTILQHSKESDERNQARIC